jgi:hypothetical protein
MIIASRFRHAREIFTYKKKEKKDGKKDGDVVENCNLFLSAW